MSLPNSKMSFPQTSKDPIFDDIRPCEDHEVESELRKIYSDTKLIEGIIKFRYPILSRFCSFVLKPIVKAKLKSYCTKIKNINDFQLKVATYMQHMMNTTTDGVEFIGFDKLDPKKGYLFISNHRDISLDPAFVDYALHLAGFNTVRIAIGDNLLRIPAATSLMRLNKCFIVKRSVASPREKLKAITHLSTYIGLSLKENNSIWIAQREGRAKNGDDKTDETVLKMFYMYGKHLGEDFKTYMSKLNIVPVSISYEYDPEDIAKANELYHKEKFGSYQKREFEDIESIVSGIKGYKGRVKLVAGTPITSGFETPTELATLIDDFIYSNYALYPSTLVAANQLDGVTTEKLDEFNKRINSYDEKLRSKVLSMYAMPYFNMLKTKARKKEL